MKRGKRKHIELSSKIIKHYKLIILINYTNDITRRALTEWQRQTSNFSMLGWQAVLHSIIFRHVS